MSHASTMNDYHKIITGCETKMVHIIGKYTASETNVINELHSYGIHIESARDIDIAIEEYQLQYPIFEKESARVHEDIIKPIEDELADANTEYDTFMQMYSKHFDDKLASMKDQIDTLNDECQQLPSGSEHIQKKISILETDMQVIMMSLHSDQHIQMFGQHDPEFMKIKERIEELNEELQNSWKECKMVIKELPTRCLKRIDVLKKMKQSNMYSGAIGEMDVVDALRELPDTYHVVNDLRFHLSPRFMINENLISHAQVDHLVIGPPGIFALETKCWKSDWTQKDYSVDETILPYKQAIVCAGVVDKALYCSNRKENNVKPIVVAARGMIREHEGSGVPVVHMDDLVSWFMSMPSVLAHEDISELIQSLYGIPKEYMRRLPEMDE